jgi:hypothetical protein
LVVRFFGKLNEGRRVLKDALEVFPTVDPFIQLTDLEHDFLGSYIILPEVCRLGLCLECCYVAFLGIEVKDSLEVWSAVSEAP